MTSPTPPNTLRDSWKSLAVILLVVVGGTQAWSWWRDTRTAELIKQYAKPDSITLYSTATCVYCAKARDWLSQHGVPWLECDVETNQVCAQTFNAQGAPGTPLVLANGRWQLGFDPVWVAQALQAPPPIQASPSSPTSPRP